MCVVKNLVIDERRSKSAGSMRGLVLFVTLVSCAGRGLEVGGTMQDV